MSSPGSILIISSGPCCRNPRPLKEALTLAAAGFGVTLLTVFETESSAAVDRALLTGSGVEMVSVGVHSSRGLIPRMQRWIARRAVRHAGLQPAGTLGPVRELLAAARRHSAQLTIVHNEAPFWVGRELLAEGRTVAADFEDWYSEDLLPEHRAFRPLRLLRALERHLLQRGAYTSTTSQALANALARQYDCRPPVVVTNSFPLQPEAVSSTSGTPPSLFWFSQTVGPGRGLEDFVLSWSRTREASRLVLMGHCSEAYRTELIRRAGARGHEIDFQPAVSPAELPAAIARHDVGLALEKNQPPSRDLTITNKILQYLNAGLAVIASDTVGQREVFAHAPGIGEMIPTEAENAAAILDGLLNNGTRLAAMKTAARRAAESRYCWERAANTLLESVRGVLRS